VEKPGKQPYKNLQNAQVIEHRRERCKKYDYRKNLKDQDETDGSRLSRPCGKWTKQKHRTAF
jgi:hypothetical protein